MLRAALFLFVTLFVPGELAFRINDADLIPEGIAYDAETKTFFVGSTFKRKIVAVDAAGKVRDFTTEAQDGAFGILGMRVDPRRRVLWAISSNAGGTMPARALDKTCLGCSTVMSYDLAAGKLVEKYELSNRPAVHFLNDLVVVPNGDVYITDTMSGNIYRIARAKKALEPFASLGPQTYPNGIDLAGDGRTLLVASSLGLHKVSTADGSVTPVKGLPGEKPPTIDGLYFHDGSVIAIQPFEKARAVVRYVLTKDYDVERAEVLEASNPHLQQPTTGVIVGSDFYYIANAQLQVFRAMYNDGAYDRAALQAVVVLKLPLRQP
jgi:sugar lactone lactonase YvrE